MSQYEKEKEDRREKRMENLAEQSHACQQRIIVLKRYCTALHYTAMPLSSAPNLSDWRLPLCA